MAQQGGIYNLNTDPEMETLIKLVGKQWKEIRKMEKVMTLQRVGVFLHAQNYS
jgi:hypothetical protein